jgi:hypothetical protein
MVAPGFFVVHDAVRPPLTDGDYQLHVSQTMSLSQASIDPAVRSLRLVGPRYALPPDQVLSVFPPPNGTGAFADRLPQIVLRRRTLPYERTMKPGDPQPAPPWLALVVLADGEGQLLTSQPLDASLPEQDDKDAPVRDVLRVSERVVQAVFPAIEDLPWLTHVREVDISDTEMALGDDDGWLAVVIANRLPVPGPPDTEGGPVTPRHYTAFLVSLEGHEGDLPIAAKAGPPQEVFTTSHVYSDAEIAAAVLVAEKEQRSPLQSAIGGLRILPQALDAAAQAAPDTADQVADRLAPEAPGGLGHQSASLAGRSFAAALPSHPADAWSASPATGNTAAASAKASTVSLSGVTGAGALKGLSINPVFYDPLARIVDFTVLTHWSFTSQPEGDFAWLMQHLDVGMLGTPPKPPPAGQTPPPPDPRPALRVTETGHVTLAATSRRGEPATVWYRSPCTPLAILRPAPTDPNGVLAHTADQLRQVGPDGLENVSLAIAFEIGRMLAASQPGVVAALLNWRRAGYAPARLGAILGSGATALHELLNASLAQARPVFSAGVVAGVLSDLGQGNAARLGPVRPLLTPPPVTGTGDQLAAAVARGFGLDAGQVAAVLGRAGASPAAAPGVPAAITQPRAPQDLGDLTAREFTGARLGLQSQVLTILGRAHPNPVQPEDQSGGEPS